jgi:hypothetical protein
LSFRIGSLKQSGICRTSIFDVSDHECYVACAASILDDVLHTAANVAVLRYISTNRQFCLLVLAVLRLISDGGIPQ